MLWINLLYPKLPTDYDLPPTIYSILNSYVNFDKEDKTKIKDLAKYGRSIIFNFDYPLTSNEDKEKFECMILNHFLMRRIGYDTVTAFRIALDVKLNEIMPFYNKLFDMLDGWDLFTDGEVVTRTQNDTRNITDSNTSATQTETQGTDAIQNAISSNDSTTSDRRYSNTPQNALSEVRDGTYVTDYNYDTNTSTNQTINNTNSSTSNTSNTTNTNNGTSNNVGSLNETITRTPSDKLRIYKEFMENRKNIYTMIFEELDPLFYGLV